MKKVEKRVSADIVASELRSAIMLGDLKMGSGISEADIADQLGVSRTPVREALRILNQEGLVELNPFKRAAVFSISQFEIENIGHFRQLIEVDALRLAMRTNLPQLVDALESVMKRMEEAVGVRDVTLYMSLDSEFHNEIVTLSSNRYLISAYALISSKISALRTAMRQDESLFFSSWDTHKYIYDAICARDTDSAVSILQRHIAEAIESFGEVLDIVVSKVVKDKNIRSSRLTSK